MEVKAMNTSNITSYKPKEFAEFLNGTVKTLQRWDSKYSSCIFMYFHVGCMAYENTKNRLRGDETIAKGVQNGDSPH